MSNLFKDVQFPCQCTPDDSLRVEGLDGRLYMVVTSDGVPSSVELSAEQAVELAKRITAAFATTTVPWVDL